MHGLQRDRQGGGFLEAHALARQRVHPAPVGDHRLGVARGARGHDLVAALHVLDLGADGRDFARHLHADYGARPADGAVGVARGHREVGAVHADGAHPDLHLGGAGGGGGDFLHFHAGGGDDGCFHGAGSG